MLSGVTKEACASSLHHLKGRRANSHPGVLMTDALELRGAGIPSMALSRRRGGQSQELREILTGKDASLCAILMALSINKIQLSLH